MNAIMILVFGVLLKFSFAPRPAEEQVQGYKLHFGATTGALTQAVDIGNVTTPDPDMPGKVYKVVDVNTSLYKFAGVSAYNSLGGSDISSAVTVTRPQNPVGLVAAPGQ